MNIFWNAVGLIGVSFILIFGASFILIFYLRLLVRMFRAALLSRSWREWGCIATGLAGAITFLIDQIDSFRRHSRPFTSDLFFVSLFLFGCSAFLAKRLTKRKAA